MWTALYAELKPKLDTLPPADVHGPADKPYGQRELPVLGPDGELIAFGMAILKPRLRILNAVTACAAPAGEVKLTA